MTSNVSSAAAGSTSAEAEPVTSKLRDLLLKFEAEHPELSAAIGKVADTLAAMGFRSEKSRVESQRLTATLQASPARRSGAFKPCRLT